jgi:hypothetical protein
LLRVVAESRLAANLLEAQRYQFDIVETILRRQRPGG